MCSLQDYMTFASQQWIQFEFLSADDKKRAGILPSIHYLNVSGAKLSLKTFVSQSARELSISY